MEIENAAFGTITMDGKTYEHDVVVRLSGEIVKRKKKLSKKYYGTSHILSKDEAKFVFEKGCEQLIVGSGQLGNVRLSPEAEAYFAKKNCKVLLQRPPRRSMCSTGHNGTEDWAFSRDLLKWTGARDGSALFFQGRCETSSGQAAASSWCGYLLCYFQGRSESAISGVAPTSSTGKPNNRRTPNGPRPR